MNFANVLLFAFLAFVAAFIIVAGFTSLVIAIYKRAREGQWYCIVSVPDVRLDEKAIASFSGSDLKYQPRDVRLAPDPNQNKIDWHLKYL